MKVLLLRKSQVLAMDGQCQNARQKVFTARARMFYEELPYLVATDYSQ
jgi:hypothetical protein